MPIALGSNLIERAKNVVDNLRGAGTDNAQIDRIVTRFVANVGVTETRTILGKDENWDPATITNAEKAGVFLFVMRRAGKSVMRVVAEQAERETVQTQINNAGTTAESDFE